VLEQLVETGLLKQESDGQIALAYSAAATDWKRLTDWIQYPTATSQDIKVGPPLKLRDVASSKTAAAPVPNSPAPPKRYWSLPAVAVIAILVVGIASLVLFKRGRQIDPGAGISSTTLAESLIDSGKLDAQKGAYVSAVSKFTSAIQLVPNSGLAFLGRGSAEISLGKYDSAIHDYTKALELNGQTSLTETYQLRGAAYERAGKFQEAIADYARASELRPDDVKLRNEIERLKKSIGLKATK
jgi:tetratricopeptide (TPR) repeat protein